VENLTEKFFVWNRRVFLGFYPAGIDFTIFARIAPETEEPAAERLCPSI
jgi:hypothetical protein